MPRTSNCPRPGCTRTDVPVRMFACSGDWFSLPVDVRNRISRSWAVRQANPTDEAARREHLDAKAAAIAWWALNPTRAQRAAGRG